MSPSILATADREKTDVVIVRELIGVELSLELAHGRGVGARRQPDVGAQREATTFAQEKGLRRRKVPRPIGRRAKLRDEIIDQRPMTRQPRERLRAAFDEFGRAWIEMQRFHRGEEAVQIERTNIGARRKDPGHR